MRVEVGSLTREERSMLREVPSKLDCAVDVVSCIETMSSVWIIGGEMSAVEGTLRMRGAGAMRVLEEAS